MGGIEAFFIAVRGGTTKPPSPATRSTRNPPRGWQSRGRTFQLCGRWTSPTSRWPRGSPPPPLVLSGGSARLVEPLLRAVCGAAGFDPRWKRLYPPFLRRDAEGCFGFPSTASREISNTDQGSQFTAAPAFTGVLTNNTALRFSAWTFFL